MAEQLDLFLQGSNKPTINGDLSLAEALKLMQDKINELIEEIEAINDILEE